MIEERVRFPMDEKSQSLLGSVRSTAQSLGIEAHIPSEIPSDWEIMANGFAGSLLPLSPDRCNSSYRDTLRELEARIVGKYVRDRVPNPMTGGSPDRYDEYERKYLPIAVDVLGVVGKLLGPRGVQIFDDYCYYASCLLILGRFRSLNDGLDPSYHEMKEIEKIGPLVYLGLI